MIRAIRKNLWNFSAIIVLFVIAGGVGAYILDHQRLRFPLIEEKPFQLEAEFQTAQAVVAGQGQTIRVSGVKIGDIAGVDLKDGRAIVRMDIDPEYKDLVHTDATALLRPKTGLKDMFVELDPGTDAAPVAEEKWRIPIRNTLPDINPDEVLSALDTDTRDYLKLLIGDAGRGLDGRGQDLQDLFRRFEPTHRDLARVTSQVAKRRKNLKRVINSLARLNGELASKDDELAGLVSSSARVFRAFASEERNLSATVAELPTALAETTRTLEKVQRFANVLRPAADDIRPAVRALDRANEAVQPFAREAAPIVRDEIRPFVRRARPLVRDLRPAADRLADATPDLTSSFTILNRLFNMLGYNENGAEPPDKATRNEGYLFWVAWLGHLTVNVFSSGDAHGTFRPVTASSTCSILRSTVSANPELEFLQGLSGALSDPRLCGRSDP